jgi:hypothetical protein
MNNSKSLIFAWITKFARKQERNQLIEYMKTGAKKPSSMNCILCLHALNKLNKFVTWLPGTQPALNKEVLKLA